jgi:molybdopterin molybdotransferase
MALLEIAAAVEKIINLAPKNAVESISISQANGRVLAQDIIAKRAQPPFNSSAMDGYALALLPEEIAPNQEFEIIGEACAGRGFVGEILSHQCVRIFTGAPVPNAAKMVIIQEDIEKVGDKIITKPTALNLKSNIRKLGGDFNSSEILIAKNTRLDAYYLSLIAAAGLPEILVYKFPNIALLCNGDELVAVGGSPSPYQIFESASFAIAALCEKWGANCQFLGVASDDLDDIKSKITAINADLLLIIGGASVGDYDLVQPALNQLGFKSSFYKVNIKPGKPTWAGKLGQMAVLGLPGNPASAMVCAQIFLRPFIFAMQNLDINSQFQKAYLAHDLKENGNRENYSRAIVENIDGRMIIRSFNNQDSSLIKIFSQSNALLREPSGQGALRMGEMVEFIPLNRGVDI